MEQRIHWLQPKRTAFWVGLLIAVMILAAPLLISFSFTLENDPASECTRFSVSFVMWSFSGLMLLLVIPLLVFVHRIVNTRLGFRDEWVLVERANGLVHIARDEDLISVNNGFIIEGVTIPTGNPKMPLYKGRDLEKWLKPRLARGDSLGPIQQLTWQWQHRRGLFIAIVVAILGGAALIAAMETGWMEEQFERWLGAQPECRDAIKEMNEGRKS